MRAIAVSNQKGGSGKTTTVVNLARRSTFDGEYPQTAQCPAGNVHFNLVANAGIEQSPSKISAGPIIIVVDQPDRRRREALGYVLRRIIQ